MKAGKLAALADGGRLGARPGRWFQPAEADPDADVQLFLLHHSGGGASMYSGWPELLPTDVACRRVQLPGRQERHAEPPFSEVDPLVEALVQALGDELDGRPYALFGHSMGALLAYRLAVAMERDGPAGPVLIGVSGWAPAGFTMSARKLIDRPDAEIVEEMLGLGSMPPEASGNRQLLAMVLPAMRADLEVCASYADDGAAVRCRVVGYSGRDDPLLAPGAMRSWATRSPRYLGNREFPGHHFFIYEHSHAITADLVQLLRRYR